MTPDNDFPRPDSSILRHLGDFRWDAVPRQEYKASGEHWRGVSRTELIAEPSSDALPFHVRYFEIEPGGFTSLEQHEHEHVVLMVRGRGTLQIEDQSKDIGVGDVVRVRSWQVHQFRNPSAAEALGFYCIVAAQRDRPRIVGGGESSCELPRG